MKLADTVAFVGVLASKIVIGVALIVQWSKMLFLHTSFGQKESEVYGVYSVHYSSIIDRRGQAGFMHAPNATRGVSPEVYVYAQG